MRQYKTGVKPQTPNVRVLVVYLGGDGVAEAYRMLARKLIERIKQS